MNFSKNEKFIILKTLRLVIYFAILIGAVYGMHFLATFLREDTFAENGVIENIQLSLLALAGLIFSIEALINIWLHRKNITKPLLKFLDSPAFYMMFSAMVAILPFGELIGHGPFIISVLGPENKAAIKELFEESCELLGYLIILLSTFECFLFVRKK